MLNRISIKDKDLKEKVRKGSSGTKKAFFALLRRAVSPQKPAKTK